jgi:hypothetical protein
MDDATRRNPSENAGPRQIAAELSKDDVLRFVPSDDAPGDDDPRWNRPAVLHFKGGESVILPDVSVRQAMSVLVAAVELGEPLGERQLDPRQVADVGPDLEVDDDGRWLRPTCPACGMAEEPHCCAGGFPHSHG